MNTHAFLLAIRCVTLCVILFLLCLCAGCANEGSAIDPRVTASGTWSFGISTGKKL